MALKPNNHSNMIEPSTDSSTISMFMPTSYNPNQIGLHSDYQMTSVKNLDWTTETPTGTSKSDTQQLMARITKPPNGRNSTKTTVGKPQITGITRDGRIPGMINGRPETGTMIGETQEEMVVLLNPRRRNYQSYQKLTLPS